MIRALAIKELREIGWIAAIGLAAYAYVVCTIISPDLAYALTLLPGMDSLTGALASEQDRLFPFVFGTFTWTYTIISLALAAALGLRQSLGEARGGTFNFLLHRPLQRRNVFLTKMASGTVLLLVASALPVLTLSIWAATPGMHPSPFEWSMTVPVWRVWIAMPVAYLAAFLCGLRAARWFGTRLFPLPAVTVPLIFACAFPLWLLVGLPVLILTVVILLTSVLWVGATRDFS